jgi:protein CpxP
MKTMRGLLLIAAAMAAVLMTPALAGVGPRARLNRSGADLPGDGAAQGGVHKVLRKLDLTDQQKQQIKDIVESHRQAMEQARQARAEALKAYGQAVAAGDESSIRSAATGVGKAMADAAVLRVQVMSEVKAVLTAEQIQKLESMKARAKQVAVLDAGPAAGRPMAAVRNRRALLLRVLSNEKVFNRLDVNGDGAITLDEIKALRAMGKAASNDL